MKNPKFIGKFFMIVIIMMIIGGITWYVIEEQKDFNRQKNQVIKVVEWQNQNRIKIYSSIKKLHDMFKTECNKEDSDINLYVLVSIRDDIMNQNPEFFSQKIRTEWKYHSNWENPIQMTGPFTELGEEIMKVDLEKIKEVYNIVDFQKKDLDTTQTYNQIRTLQQLFLNKKFLLEDLVYVRNEIMKHYNFHFELDSATKWSQHSKTEEITIIGPFRKDGTEIK